MMTMMPRTRYKIGPILESAILEKIKREGLAKAQYDPPIAWYVRSYCLRPRPKQRHFAYQGSPTYQVQRTPVLAGQAG